MPNDNIVIHVSEEEISYNDIAPKSAKTQNKAIVLFLLKLIIWLTIPTTQPI